MSEQSSVKKKYKKVILGDQKFDLDEGLSVEEILEAIKEDNPAYSNASQDNCYVDEDGNLVISQPKSKTNG
ncbi:hypothetical protein ACSW8S_18990 (plasmid) [Clostridium perfringens]